MMSENKYSDEDIVLKLSKYGTVYLHDKISDRVENIIGCMQQKERLEDFFNVLKNYYNFANELKKSNLVPNITMLLYGPPGTGKTSLTRAFAHQYNFNMCVVESDRLVSSLLGETIKNIREVFEAAVDVTRKNNTPFLLFFDEIDAIGSERSSVHEVGEIKRAVISFLQTIDRINYEQIPLAIIGATNHQQQLDSAMWRRFTFHLKFDIPNYQLREKIIKSFIMRIKKARIPLDDSIIKSIDDEKVKIDSISEGLDESISEDILMEEVKKQGKDNLFVLTHGYSGSDIERAIRVALFKVLGGYPVKKLTYKILYDSLKLVGGTTTHVDRQEALAEPVYLEKRQRILDSNLFFNNEMDKNSMLINLENLISILEDLHNYIKETHEFIENSNNIDTKEFEFYSILTKINKLRQQ